jgi:hypothetical protein
MSALVDPRDPIRHDVTGEMAVKAIIRRSIKWIKASADRPDLYCGHGTYVGFQRSLAYLCPLCLEPSRQKPTVPEGNRRA